MHQTNPGHLSSLPHHHDTAFFMRGGAARFMTTRSDEWVESGGAPFSCAMARRAS